jgi:hypothetical protein
VLEQPAQALGCADDCRIAERSGFSLDVVRGAKQIGMGLFGEALAHHLLSRRFQALAFALHPRGEFAGKVRQRRFGARHRIVIRCGRLHDGLGQRVRGRDDFVVGERGD